MVRSLETLPSPLDTTLALCGHDNDMEILLKFPLCVTVTGSSSSFCVLQTTTEKHRMSFPETVDEILDVSEDEGKVFKLLLPT